MIFGICHSLLSAPNRDNILADLSKVKSGIDLLASVANPFSTATHFARILIPLYEQSKELVRELGTLSYHWRDPRMSVHTVLNNKNLFDPSRAVVLVGQAIAAMKIRDNL